MNETIRLIDVGARGGIDPRWAPYHDTLDVIAFEPDTVECDRLNSTAFPYRIRFLPVALGDTDNRTSTLHLCRQPGCSSLLEPNMDFCGMFPYAESMEVVGQYPLTLQRMDSVVRDFEPGVIKVDTQGTELDVLRGAGHLLDSAIAIELEVEFVPQYRGQALFCDVDIFMRAQGFTLRGIKRSYWRARAQHTHSHGGQIVHGDALYLRLDRIDCPIGHRILAAYNQFDLLAAFGATSLIPRRSFARRQAAKLLSGFSHRRLRRLVDSLRDTDATDWHDPDFF